MHGNEGDPVTEGRAAEVGPVTEGRAAEVGAVTEGCAAEVGVVTEGRAAEVGVVTEGRADEGGPVTEGRTTEAGATCRSDDVGPRARRKIRCVTEIEPREIYPVPQRNGKVDAFESHTHVFVDWMLPRKRMT
jgi:hypothetical protein